MQNLIEISAEAKAAVLKLIQDADGPVKSGDLIKRAGLPKKVSGKALQAALEEELKSQRIFNWGTKTNPLYWDRGPDEEARERLLEIAASELLDKAALTARAMARLPKIPKSSVTDTYTKLVKARSRA